MVCVCFFAFSFSLPADWCTYIYLFNYSVTIDWCTMFRFIFMLLIIRFILIDFVLPKSFKVIDNIDHSFKMQKSESSNSSLEYKLVESGKSNVLRYQVKYSTGKTDGSRMETTDRNVTIASWIDILRNSKSERDQFVQTLLLLPDNVLQWDAVFFETKGASKLNHETKSMEFVLVKAPAERFQRADSDTFQSQFSSCSTSNKNENYSHVCAFDSLRGDARLITPLPPSSSSTNKHTHNDPHIDDYTDILSFVRSVSYSPLNAIVMDHLLQLTLREYHKLLNMEPASTVWLSTSGLGVSWLHIRLDSRPKYYSYREFAQEY